MALQLLAVEHPAAGLAPTMLGAMRVYICRHAKAADGEPDELRELTPKGVDQARALADRLASLPSRPCSSSRARSSARARRRSRSMAADRRS